MSDRCFVKKVRPNDNHDDCSICLRAINKGLVKTTPCGHCFHPKCLNKWTEMKPTCPVCRAAVLVPRSAKRKLEPIFDAVMIIDEPGIILETEEFILFDYGF